MIRQDSKAAAQFDWRVLGSDLGGSDIEGELAALGFGPNMNQ